MASYRVQVTFPEEKLPLLEHLATAEHRSLSSLIVHLAFCALENRKYAPPNVKPPEDAEDDTPPPRTKPRTRTTGKKR